MIDLDQTHPRTCSWVRQASAKKRARLVGTLSGTLLIRPLLSMFVPVRSGSFVFGRDLHCGRRRRTAAAAALSFLRRFFRRDGGSRRRPGSNHGHNRGQAPMASAMAGAGGLSRQDGFSQGVQARESPQSDKNCRYSTVARVGCLARKVVASTKLGFTFGTKTSQLWRCCCGLGIGRALMVQ